MKGKSANEAAQERLENTLIKPLCQDIIISNMQGKTRDERSLEFRTFSNVTDMYD